MSICDPPDLRERPSRIEPNWDEPVQAPIPSSRQDLSGNLWKQRREWARERLFTFLAATELRDAAIATLRALRSRKAPTESQERVVLHWGDLVTSIDGPGMIKELHGSSSDLETRQKFNSIYHKLRTTFRSGERSEMESQLAELSRSMVFDGSKLRDRDAAQWAQCIADQRQLLLLDSPKIEADSSPIQETRQHRKPLTPSEISLVQQLRKEGFKTLEIGEIMGLPDWTVRRHSPVNKPKVTDDDIREAYSRLGSVDRVKEALFVGRPTAYAKYWPERQKPVGLMGLG